MHQPPRLDVVAYLKGLSAGEVPALTTRIETTARVRFAVAQAIARGRVQFHFQPVVRSCNPRFPAFFEMLARIVLPDGRVLPAAAFLPHVEEGPLGRAIDRLALDAALEALAGDPALRVSINVSPRSMGDADWLARLAEAGRERRVTGRLILEITETAALEQSDQTLDFLEHARGFGCALALDDFGAGMTGFRQFRDFRFDIVKIDGCFAQGVSRSPDSRLLVECLVKIARHFEMLTVAERVECAADATCLEALGVDCFQGYRFGRPVAEPVLPAVSPLRKAG
jgi:EAL domain-containing protein (putative c-di-GMP-specific phosphodiesterase class I)